MIRKILALFFILITTNCYSAVINNDWSSYRNLTWTIPSYNYFINSNTTFQAQLHCYSALSSDISTFINNINLGGRVKYIQAGVANNSSIEVYGIITTYNYSSTDVTINVFLGTDFGFANKPVLSLYTSNNKVPSGFNSNPNNWSVIYTYNDEKYITNATPNSLYVFQDLKVDIPAGSWDGEYTIYPRISNDGVPAGTSSANICLGLTNSTTTINNYDLITCISEITPEIEFVFVKNFINLFEIQNDLIDRYYLFMISNTNSFGFFNGTVPAITVKLRSSYL